MVKYAREAFSQPTNQPPNFFCLIIFQPTMPTFEQLWQLFLHRGALANQREETAKLWSNYSPEQQQHIFDTLTTKLRQRRFVHYNPMQAIRENAPRNYSGTMPANYNGARSFPDEPLVIAICNGQGGIYTRREAELFDMDIRKPFNP